MNDCSDIWFLILFVILGLILGGVVGSVAGGMSGRNDIAQYVCEQSGYQEGHWTGEAIVCGNAIIEFEVFEQKGDVK